MAVLSWCMDKGIEKIREGHIMLYELACGALLSTDHHCINFGEHHWMLSYLAWTAYTVCILIVCICKL